MSDRTQEFNPLYFQARFTYVVSMLAMIFTFMCLSLNSPKVMYLFEFELALTIVSGVVTSFMMPKDDEN